MVHTRQFMIDERGNLVRDSEAALFAAAEKVHWQDYDGQIWDDGASTLEEYLVSWLDDLGREPIFVWAADRYSGGPNTDVAVVLDGMWDV